MINITEQVFVKTFFKFKLIKHLIYYCATHMHLCLVDTKNTKNKDVLTCCCATIGLTYSLIIVLRLFASISQICHELAVGNKIVYCEIEKILIFE